MKMRVLAVVAALAVMVGLPVAAVKLLLSHPSAAAHPADTVHRARVHRYAQEYVGIVSDDVAAFYRSCKCHPNMAIHYISMGGPVSMTLAKLVLESRAVPCWNWSRSASRSPRSSPEGRTAG